MLQSCYYRMSKEEKTDTECAILDSNFPILQFLLWLRRNRLMRLNFPFARRSMANIEPGSRTKLHENHGREKMAESMSNRRDEDRLTLFSVNERKSSSDERWTTVFNPTFADIPSSVASKIVRLSFCLFFWSHTTFRWCAEKWRGRRVAAKESQGREKNTSSCDVHCTYCRLQSLNVAVFFLRYLLENLEHFLWNITLSTCINLKPRVLTSLNTKHTHKHAASIESSSIAQFVGFLSLARHSFTSNYIILMLWWTLKFL